jgi:hypothetical protein
MRETAAAEALAVEEDDPVAINGGSTHLENGATAPARRLLKRPTLAETNRIIVECPSEGLTVPVIVAAIRQETGCSRATAYRAIADAFTAGIISRKDEAAS